MFVFIAYLLFSTFRKAEQNQLWAGMAKETAHQLGTPISSLMGWTQYLEQQKIDPMIVNEMHKDIDRLNIITDRFSKIGSAGKMEEKDLEETVNSILNYLRKRISDKIKLDYTISKDKPLLLNHNPTLIEWVIENIVKNAVDAMDGEGSLKIELRQKEKTIEIDISDNGKGMASNKFKTIFKPGFTSKKRGWGLGLPLAKRIIQDYHKGQIFVQKSEF